MRGASPCRGWSVTCFALTGTWKVSACGEWWYWRKMSKDHITKYCLHLEADTELFCFLRRDFIMYPRLAMNLAGNPGRPPKCWDCRACAITPGCSDTILFNIFCYWGLRYSTSPILWFDHNTRINLIFYLKFLRSIWGKHGESNLNHVSKMLISVISPSNRIYIFSLINILHVSK